MGSEIWKPIHLKYEQMGGRHFDRTNTTQFQMVKFSNGWDHALAPLKTWPFEIQCTKSFDFE